MICRLRNTFLNAFALLLVQSVNVVLCVILSTSTSLAEDSDPVTSPPPDSANEANDLAPPPELKKPPERLELTYNKLLADSLRNYDPDNSEQVWLSQGKDQYLGLFIDDFSGKRIGNILILHDNQQHPDWPGITHDLRTALPATGWSTLSISVPYFDLTPKLPKREPPIQPSPQSSETEPNEQSAPPEDEKQKENNEPKNEMEAASEAVENRQVAEANMAAIADAKIEYSREQIPEIVNQRIREAIANIKGRNQRPIIVVASGLSASWALSAVKSMPKQDVAGLAIIDAAQPKLLEGYNVDTDIAKLTIPVLDIAPTAGQRSPASTRAKIAKKTRQVIFQQRLISGSSQSLTQNTHQVIMSIRGWCKRHFQR